MKYLYVILASVFLFTACDPEEADKTVLGDPPTNISFEIIPLGGINEYRLVNTTPNTFIQQWDLGNGQLLNGEEVVAFYPQQGSYVVTLTVFNESGHGVSAQSIDVLEDAPSPCNPNSIMEFLSNCDTRTWTLNPAEGAYFVGPNDGTGTTWWQNSADEINARPCAFDDEWIFTPDGVMVYDTKGEIWAEDYMGFDFECIDETLLTADLASWGAGNHAFLVDETAMTLDVVGLGAFIGLPKVATGAEVTTPQSGVKYDIVEMIPDDGNGNRLIKLQVLYNGDSALWRFTLKASN